MTFDDLNFNEHLAEGLRSMGYITPTPVQAAAIPAIAQGKDMIVCAQTGTGKTAAFLLPVLNQINEEDKHYINTLILVPTRELAQQIDQQAEGLAYFTGISSVAVFGGGDGIVYEQQRRAIHNNVNIIIATPGRLIAHLTSGALKLDKLRHLVLDEADRMLDMGFQDDITRIIRYLPTERQTLLFSATMPPRIRKLANTILRNPEQISLSISKPAEGVSQQVYRVADHQKVGLIKMLLKDGNYSSTIIFASTKEKVKQLNKELKAVNLKVSAFSSDFKQSEREQILLDFKNRTLPIIIGTDALSRGIDVEGIDLVMNYDAPPDPEDYIHRIGRTARAATTGTAITFINHRDERKLKRIEEMIGKSIPQMPLPAELGEAPAPPVERPHRNDQPNSDQGRRDNNRKKKKWPRKNQGNKPEQGNSASEKPASA